MAEDTSRYWRQLDILPIDRLQKMHVVIIGCGSVGSFTALMLGKMGVGNLHLYDDDKVELHNLPVQFFKNTDIGKFKVEALQAQLKEMTEATIVIHPEKFEKQDIEGIVISAVDSMQARKAIWQSLRTAIKVPLYIDTRMGAMVSRIYSFNPFDMLAVERYQKTLYSDEKAVEERCTEKAIIFTVGGISAAVAGLLRKFVRGEQLPPEIIQDFTSFESVVIES